MKSILEIEQEKVQVLRTQLKTMYDLCRKADRLSVTPKEVGASASYAMIRQLLETMKPYPYNHGNEIMTTTTLRKAVQVVQSTSRRIGWIQSRRHTESQLAEAFAAWLDALNTVRQLRRAAIAKARGADHTPTTTETR